MGLDQISPWLAVLPGSRGGEMSLIAQPFIETCQRIKQKYPDINFVVALVNEQRKEPVYRDLASDCLIWNSR